MSAISDSEDLFIMREASILLSWSNRISREDDSLKLKPLDCESNCKDDRPKSNKIPSTWPISRIFKILDNSE